MKLGSPVRHSGRKQTSTRGGGGTSVSTRPRARRLSPELAQEKRSRGQFIERLGEVGWNEYRPEQDVGEDFAIQIYDDGRSTGLTFYVQLKSIRDAERHRPRRGPEELRYRLEVKDLEHWEASAVPVVLVVWDVGARRGFWQMIPKIIADLDHTSPGWRSRRTATVSLPLEHGTDDAGLKRLRWAVADHLEPLVPKVGNVEIEFSFPPTSEGKAAAEALQSALETGGGATVDGSFIAAIQLPQWQARLYGPAERPLLVEIKPRSSAHSIPVRVEVETAEGSIALSRLEFRASRLGTKRITLEHEERTSPLKIRIDLDRVGGQSSFTIQQLRQGSTVAEEKEITGFLLALHRPGSRVRFIDLERGSVIFRSPSLETGRQGRDLAPQRRYYDLIEKLCFIQSRIGAGEFALRGNLTHEEAETIDDLFRIVRDGRVERAISLKIDLDPVNPHPIRPTDNRIVLHPVNVRPVELLGLPVELGEVRVIVKDAEGFLAKYRAAMRDAVSTGRPVRLVMHDVPIIEEYIDWLPESTRRDRLSEVAATRGGYFTQDQAFDAGYASVDILEAEERIERCGGGVFRLAQFPRSEHEDLIILSLRAGGKGVFSHDTALFLHGLSDVLPIRHHITVPPGWSPPEGGLGEGVVVHHAVIEESDMAWFGPVPATRPLRTIQDCIEDHLSPDLVEQAIEDAFHRGMLDRADVERLQAVRAQSA